MGTSFWSALTDSSYTRADLAGMLIGLTALVIVVFLAAMFWIEKIRQEEEQHYERLKAQNDSALLRLIQGKPTFVIPREPYDWEDERD